MDFVHFILSFSIFLFSGNDGRGNIISRALARVTTDKVPSVGPRWASTDEDEEEEEEEEGARPKRRRPRIRRTCRRLRAATAAETTREERQRGDSGKKVGDRHRHRRREK